MTEAHQAIDAAAHDDGHLDLDARGDRDGGDLLDDLRRRVQVDEALVDAHLEAVPRVRTFAAGRFARRDAQLLRGHAHGAADLQLLVDRAALQVGADRLQRFHIARRERDADAVDRLRLERLGLLRGLFL